MDVYCSLGTDTKNAMPNADFQHCALSAHDNKKNYLSNDKKAVRVERS